MALFLSVGDTMRTSGVFTESWVGLGNEARIIAVGLVSRSQTY